MFIFTDISTVLMVIHQDSIEETSLNQIKTCFQTIIDLNGTDLKKNDEIKFSKHVFKYDLKIKQKNFKSSSKITNYVRKKWFDIL